MNNQPFFTIGIPVYNTGKWVGACIDSIYAQKFDDFELICVDDGSHDNSLQVLQQYEANDERIKIISRDNGGPSTARNSIIKAARGKYIYMIDSDDTMCENVLWQAYNKIAEDDYPDILQLGLLKNHYSTIREWMPTAPFSPQEYGLRDDQRDEFTLNLWLDNKIRAEASSKFIRSDFLTSSGIMYHSTYCQREDGDFAVRLTRKAKTISILPIHSFTYYLPREGSLSTTFSYKSYKSVISYYRDFFEELEFWDVSDDMRKRLDAEKARQFTEHRDYLLMIFDGSKSRAEILAEAAMVERLAGDYIKSLPLPKGKNGIIFFICRIIGIEKTMNLLYSFLKLKGIVK